MKPPIHSLILLVTLTLSSQAQPSANTGIPRPEEAPLLYQSLPDIAVDLGDGHKRALSSLWQQRPLLVTFVFTRCAGVCSPFLRALRSVSADARGAGTDYDFLVLSFDTRDTTNEMSALSQFTGTSGQNGWHFGLAAPEDIERLTRAVGFKYQWNAASQQFDHPASLVAIREGKVIRLLTGGAISPARFREVLSELRGDFVPIYPAVADTRFRCFEFSADGVLRPSWGLLILVYPALMALSLTAAVFLLARRRPVEPENPIAERRAGTSLSKGMGAAHELP